MVDVLAGLTGQLSDQAEVHSPVSSSASLWPVSRALSRSLACAAAASHTCCRYTRLSLRQPAGPRPRPRLYLQALCGPLPALGPRLVLPQLSQELLTRAQLG
jgi:hypothetical protein